MPTLTHENEIDMQEGGTGVKRGQPECIENPCNGKLRRRDGIQRSLRDIASVNYEEYNTCWDLEDQSKRCKRVVNCLLASCKCKAENEPIRNESGVMPVHLVPDTVAELGRQTGTRDMDGTVQLALLPGPSSSNTGPYSNTAAWLSPTTTLLVQITQQTQLVSCTTNQGVFSHLGAVIDRQE